MSPTSEPEIEMSATSQPKQESILLGSRLDGIRVVALRPQSPALGIAVAIACLCAGIVIVAVIEGLDRLFEYRLVFGGALIGVGVQTLLRLTELETAEMPARPTNRASQVYKVTTSQVVPVPIDSELS